MIEVRPVRAGDWELLRGIRLSALLDAPDSFGSTYEREAAFDEAMWRARTASSAGFFALADGEPIGLAAGIYDEDDCGPRERLLVSVWVAPEHRGRRVVGRLVDSVAAWARADGASVLRLDVALHNDAARLAYLRLGFVPTGQTKPLERDASILEESMTLAL